MIDTLLHQTGEGQCRYMHARGGREEDENKMICLIHFGCTVRSIIGCGDAVTSGTRVLPCTLPGTVCAYSGHRPVQLYFYCNIIESALAIFGTSIFRIRG